MVQHDERSEPPREGGVVGCVVVPEDQLAGENGVHVLASSADVDPVVEMVTTVFAERAGDDPGRHGPVQAAAAGCVMRTR